MLEKLDPRVKLLMVIIYSVITFLIDKFPVAVIFMSCIFCIRIALGPRSFKSYISLLWLVLFIILLQFMFVPGKNHIIKPIIPGIGFTKEGLFFGLMTGCRIIALMLLLPMLTAMTGNHQIALALNRLGLNYRVSFIISTAFLFIPVFKDTAKDIIDAQKLRGCVSFERAFFVTRLKAYSTLAIPLVLGAMKKAQAAGDAMDSRAFGVFKTRTWVDNLTMKKHDFIFMAASAVLGVVFLFFNYR